MPDTVTLERLEAIAALGAVRAVLDSCPVLPPQPLVDAEAKLADALSDERKTDAGS